ncbi:MAG: type II toxin-antitoxin system VapC family toxin [Myxococcota bacterium]
MRYLIDTNVISELRKRQNANKNLLHWFEQVSEQQLFLSVLTIGEIRNGIERIRRRDAESAEHLDAWLQQVEDTMAGNILPITRTIANHWGTLGIPNRLSVIDSLLAATALVHDLTLVIRNTRDVETTGVKLLNPFE